MSDRTADDRLTAIETALMHLQHDVEQVHEALVGQRRDLEDLRTGIVGLRGRIDRMEAGPEDRDPTLERPPHY